MDPGSGECAVAQVARVPGASFSRLADTLREVRARLDPETGVLTVCAAVTANLPPPRTVKYRIQMWGEPAGWSADVVLPSAAPPHVESPGDPEPPYLRAQLGLSRRRRLRALVETTGTVRVAVLATHTFEPHREYLVGSAEVAVDVDGNSPATQPASDGKLP
jgi:hypothetical protein